MLEKLEYGVHVGEFNPDGSIKQDVTHCALSGGYVVSIHSVRVRLTPPNNRFFFRVLADHYRMFDEGVREKIEQQALAVLPTKQSKPKKGEEE